MSNVPSSPVPTPNAVGPDFRDNQAELMVSLLREHLEPFHHQIERLRSYIDSMDQHVDDRIQRLEESARRGFLSPNRVSERILSSDIPRWDTRASKVRASEDDSSEGESMMADFTRPKSLSSSRHSQARVEERSAGDSKMDDSSRPRATTPQAEPPDEPRPESRFEVGFEMGGRTYQIHRRRDSFTGTTLPRTPAVPSQGTSSNASGTAKSRVQFRSDQDSPVDPFEPAGNLESLGEMLDGPDFHSPKKSGGQRHDTSSYLDRQYFQVDKVTESYQPTFFKSEPPHNILLTSLTLASVIRFVDEVLDYQYRYGVRLRVGTLIKSNVAQELVDRLEGLTLPVLLSMPTRYVFKTLQLEICPSTSYEFYHRIDATVKFNLSVPKGYRPSPGEYKPFYNALLNYRKQFVRAYDILVTFADPHIIPPFNTKRFGLIKLFLDKIPYDYGYRLHQSDLEHKLISREITHIYQYIKVFFTHVTNHFETYRQVRIMGQHFGGSEYAAGDNLNRRTNSTFVRTDRRHQSISHVTSTVPLFDPPESDDPKDDSNAYAYDNFPSDQDLHADPYDPDEAAPTASLDDDTDEPSEFTPADEDDPDDPFQDEAESSSDLLPSKPQLHAIPSHKKDNRSAPSGNTPKSSTEACRAAAMSKDGRCPKLGAGQRCIYNHDKAVLRAEHQRLAAMLSASIFASDTTLVPQMPNRRTHAPPSTPKVLSHSFPSRKSP